MATSSLDHPVRREPPAATSTPATATAPRRSRTQAVLDLVCEATASFVDRFCGQRGDAGPEMRATATRANSSLREPGRRNASPEDNEEARLTASRQATAQLLTALELHLDRHSLRRWFKNDPEARAVRTVGQRCAVGQVGYHNPAGMDSYAPWLQQDDPGVVANTIICLIHQANYLLDRQLHLLAQGFRSEAPKPAGERKPGENGRQTPSLPDRAEPVPACPKCGLPMILRTARRGAKAGKRFWGCSAYPNCHGLREEAGG
jgi:hypothetical protein